MTTHQCKSEIDEDKPPAVISPYSNCISPSDDRTKRRARLSDFLFGVCSRAVKNYHNERREKCEDNWATPLIWHRSARTHTQIDRESYLSSAVMPQLAAKPSICSAFLSPRLCLWKTASVREQKGRNRQIRRNERLVKINCDTSSEDEIGSFHRDALLKH